VVTGLRHTVFALHFNLGGEFVSRSSRSGHVSVGVKLRRIRPVHFCLGHGSWSYILAHNDGDRGD
jgi:hypothetical protein